MKRNMLFVSLIGFGLAFASGAQAHEDGDYQNGGDGTHALLHGLGIPHSHGGYGHGGDGYGYGRARYGYGYRRQSRHEYLHEHGIAHGGYHHQLHDYGIPHEHAY